MPEDSDYVQSYAGLAPESGGRSVVTAPRQSWAARIATWLGLETDSSSAEEVADEDDWILSDRTRVAQDELPSRPAA
jgi:hypothetical protein